MELRFKLNSRMSTQQEHGNLQMGSSPATVYVAPCRLGTMRFTASSADLLKALQTVSGAVPNKSTLPILECILFERDGNTLRLSATDLEISIRQKLSVPVDAKAGEGPSRVAVPARRLVAGHATGDTAPTRRFTPQAVASAEPG